MKEVKAILLSLVCMGFFTIVTACTNVTTSTSPSADTVSTPVFGISSGTYGGIQIVTLSSSTTGASIYYTTDGAVPTTSSSLYGSEILVTASETIKAIAVKTGMTNSDVASVSYIINIVNTGASSDGLPCYFINGTQSSSLSMPTESVGGKTYRNTISDGVLYVTGYTYTTGNSANQLYYQPCFWKDGSRTDLSLPSGATGGYAVNGPFVLNGAYYSAGYYYDSTGVQHPCYWHNGDCSVLSATSVGGASEIFVVGSDIYVAGRILTSSSPTVAQLCYWKNGTISMLDIGSASFGEVGQIHVINGNFYITGAISINSVFTPCYWKDGKRTDLSYTTSSSASGGAHAYGFYIDGNDVYVAGVIHDSWWYPYAQPCYWKNGVFSLLSLPSGVSRGGGWDFTKENGHVYVRGSGLDVVCVCVWFNGTLTSTAVY
jgi:hypothetical protein